MFRQPVCRKLAAADSTRAELHTAFCKLGRLFNWWGCAANHTGTTGWQLFYAMGLRATAAATGAAASALRVAVTIMVPTGTTVTLLRGVCILRA